MRKCITLLTLVFLWNRDVDAAFENSGVTASAMGMGGAYTAVARDTSALIWNPAGLVQLHSPEIGLSYTELYGILGYSFIGWAHPIRARERALRDFQTIGAALLSSSDTEGLSQEQIVLLSGATYVPRFPIHVGVNIKYFSTSVNLPNRDMPALTVPLGQGDGWGLDVGVRYRLSIQNLERVTIGVMFPNLLSQLYYRRQSVRYNQALLTEWRIGCAVILDSMLAAFELENGHPLIGCEYRLNSDKGTVALRFGWRFTGGVSRGLTLGFGYHGGNIVLDYAFVNGRYDAQSSRFSVRLSY